MKTFQFLNTCRNSEKISENLKKTMRHFPRNSEQFKKNSAKL